MYTDLSYDLYVAGDNVCNFLILDCKLRGKNCYLIFDWDLTLKEITDITLRFHDDGLTIADFQNTTWQGGDFRPRVQWFQLALEYIRVRNGGEK